MTHEQIHESDTRTRYVMRRLSTEEEHTFEDHLVGCLECQEEIQREMDLRDALQHLAPASSPLEEPAKNRWLVPMLAAAAVLLLVASATLAVRLNQAASELRMARAAVGDLERRSATA